VQLDIEEDAHLRTTSARGLVIIDRLIRVEHAGPHLTLSIPPESQGDLLVMRKLVTSLAHSVESKTLAEVHLATTNA
jgi:hypothetical protein